MLKTGTYLKLQTYLMMATKGKNALPKAQAKLIQKVDNYQAQYNQDKKTLVSILKKNGYHAKTERIDGKETVQYVSGKKVVSGATEEYVTSLQNDMIKQHDKHEKMLKDSKYKQAVSHFNRLSKREKSAYNNMFRYKAAMGIKPVAKPKEDNVNDFLAPHARIYPTESKSTGVVYLFSQSESESNSSDVTKYTVDKDEPVSDHSRNSEKTLSIQGMVVGSDSIGQEQNKLKSAEWYYQRLLKYKREGTQLTYMSNGSNSDKTVPHIYMHNLVISTLEKQLDQATVDAFKVNITFEFVYKAAVLSSKRNVNNKGKKSKKGKYAGPKHVTVKRGTTFYSLAKQYGTSVSQLERWNGSTLTVGKKVQVTAGQVASSKTTAKSKTKIYQRTR